MKKIHRILLALVYWIAVCGCNQFKYEHTYKSYTDSFYKYSDLFNCYLKCHNDSSDWAYKKEAAFSDSADFYYDKMYPKGSLVDTPLKEQKKCNCP